MAQQASATAFQTFLDEVYKDYEQSQENLRQIDILIKQNDVEVRRLVQRELQVKNQVRQMQTNIDTQPRDYIQEVYEGQLDVAQRLYTMRGQLEKLQSDQRNLERLVGLQRKLLDVTEGMGSLPTTKNTSRRHESNDQGSNVIRVIQTEETGKQSLVRRMHDGPASALSNFILQAEICQRFFDVNPDRARAELNALKTAAAATFSDVKDFIFDLRPMMLDDLGVVPTLRRYGESFQEKNGIPVSITITGVERRLESHIEVTIFRGVQELLSNTLAHARATQIQVSLDLAQDHVQAIVEDNGSGFNVDEVMGADSRTIGLVALRERIEMLGGELNIQSSLGQGSRIEFIIPVEPDFAGGY